MEDGSSRDEKQVVSDPASDPVKKNKPDRPVKDDEPKGNAKNQIVTNGPSGSSVPKRVQETVDAALPYSTIKVRTEQVAEALRRSFAAKNPKYLKVVVKENLGHHSIAVQQ